MWYGKTTEELKKLNEEYYKLFGGYPFGHMELEYEADEYDEYVRDIKKAIRIKKPLTEFVEQVPPVEYDWWSSYIQKAGKEEVA